MGCRPRAVAEDERKLESAVRKSQISAKLGATQIKVQAPVCADLGASRLKCDKTAHSIRRKARHAVCRHGYSLDESC